MADHHERWNIWLIFNPLWTHHPIFFALFSIFEALWFLVGGWRCYQPNSKVSAVSVEGQHDRRRQHHVAQYWKKHDLSIIYVPLLNFLKVEWKPRCFMLLGSYQIHLSLSFSIFWRAFYFDRKFLTSKEWIGIGRYTRYISWQHNFLIQWL